MNTIFSCVSQIQIVAIIKGLVHLHFYYIFPDIIVPFQGIRIRHPLLNYNSHFLHLLTQAGTVR